MADILSRLQEQVRRATERGQALVIRGGGSKAFLGRDTAGEVLDTRPHSGIVSYQPVELVLTARAGTTLEVIEAALEAQGQMLAFEPPHFGPDATLGGTLACNLSGPGRPWWGSVRDHVLGIRLINGRGEHLRFGGQVMKNVAGYDVSRLQAGAMGTLGVITEISLKVLPQAAMSLTLVQEQTAAAAIALMNRYAGKPGPLSAACWADGRLYLRLSGAASAVKATAERYGGEVPAAGAFWQTLREQQLGFFQPARAGDACLWRFSVRPTARLPDLPGAWLLDWAGAQRWYCGPGERAVMEGLATAMGGEVTLFRNGDRRAEVFHTRPAALQTLQRRLKQQFDPAGIFNPGRVYGWL
ncbi:MAG TPA: glycolate oxidase subunit GlcE [Thiolinea sp.]|nr:glycolate oxidase subunit GlcE [Thiolinea sp.]